MNTSAETPGPGRGDNRKLLMILRVLEKFLAVFFLCLGTTLLVMSYLVWKNNDPVPAVLGTALFVFAGISFFGQGVRGVRRWIRRRRGGPQERP